MDGNKNKFNNIIDIDPMNTDNNHILNNSNKQYSNVSNNNTNT